jgi:hypothetical protein
MSLTTATKPRSAASDILSVNPLEKLIPSNRELIPDIDELYELHLAFFESSQMNDEELVRNGAYFSRIGDRLTRHFLMCRGEPVRLPRHSSSRLRSFFSSNQFRTGYATHGLFPYRGKFHPQMIKGLINSMGLKPGDRVLDPMMGSGTVLIEASLMGIRSVGLDISPFCRFITKVKLDALRLPIERIRPWLRNPRPVFEYFKQAAGVPNQGSKSRHTGGQEELFAIREPSGDGKAIGAGNEGLDAILENPSLGDFLLLAYFDSAGYAERSNRKSPFEQFRAILERYVFVVEKIQKVIEGAEDELGEAAPEAGDARKLALDDQSIDGIIFSPPYSFAIDYLANDSFHLKSMGIDTEQLREDMVGLRGHSRLEKYENYLSDMGAVISECSRVLRSGGICSIVVGTNNNQLSKIVGLPAEDVQGIDELLAEVALHHRLHLIRKLARRITGMANTMRTEYILMLEKR